MGSFGDQDYFIGDTTGLRAYVFLSCFSLPIAFFFCSCELRMSLCLLHMRLIRICPGWQLVECDRFEFMCGLV